VKYLSVCSGIEAATVAWHSFGWEPWAFAEIEAFPSAVLAHHYPDVPNLGDMTKFQEWPDAAIDVLVGGTPCQSFSVAGLRKGLDDPRGNLMLTYGAIARRYRPKWLVWENVPGVLSSNGGRDFGAFLGLLAELGYGFAYRVLDAQYFGLAQRRRRVFVVGCSGGDWRRAAAVLFERASLRGDPAPRRAAPESAARDAAIGPPGSGGCQPRTDGSLVPQGCGGEVAPTLNAAFGSKLGLDNQHIDSGAGLFVQEVTGELSKTVAARNDMDTASLVAHTLRGAGFDASEDGTGRGTPLVPVHAFDARQSDVIQYGDMTRPLDTDGHTMAVAIHENQRGEITTNDTVGALNSGGGKPGQGYAAAMTGMQVRRLTPRECERLQGFPDDYTLVPHRGKPAADGPRYKALGNSMAVPCMAWLGRRIAMVDAI
jgi:DNA (cytosine-5)-methyltransferase 1